MVSVTAGQGILPENCGGSKAEREAAGCATRASLAEETIKRKVPSGVNIV